MTEAVARDRRHRRREETVEQVLSVAVDVMNEQGVAGLTLGEVARRMGIRTPSLYVYFDGKNALYDALFRKGWAELLAVLRAGLTGNALEDLHRSSETFVRWSMERPAYAPLMHWRPVPGFTPTDAAFAPSVETVQGGHELVARLQDDGVLRRDVDVDRAFRSWIALLVGVITQQLANAPGEPYDTGAYTSTLPDLIAMWLAHYGPARA